MPQASGSRCPAPGREGRSEAQGPKPKAVSEQASGCERQRFALSSREKRGIWVLDCGQDALGAASGRAGITRKPNAERRKPNTKQRSYPLRYERCFSPSLPVTEDMKFAILHPAPRMRAVTCESVFY